MKDKKLRSQLAQCIRYYKRMYGDWPKRDYTEQQIYSEATHINGAPSVKDIIEFCDDNGYDVSKVFVDGYETRDYDDYPEYWVRLFIKCKCSDQEYFDSVTNSLAPQWQYDRYKQYESMKKEFEETK